jgi:hypothetical protein
VSVGQGHSDILIDYEMDDGKIEKIDVADCIQRILATSFARMFHLNNILFPRFLNWDYTPWNFRYKRNI